MSERMLLGERGREIGGYLRMITEGLALGIDREAEGSPTRQVAAEHIHDILPGVQLSLGFTLIDRLCALAVPEYSHPPNRLIDYWRDQFSHLETLSDFPWDELRTLYLIRNQFIHSLGRLDERAQSAEIIRFLRRLETREITYSVSPRAGEASPIEPYFSIIDNQIVFGNWLGRFRGLIRDLYIALYDEYAPDTNSQ